MRFSIFHNIGAPGRLDDVATVLDEVREVATFADNAGYHSIWYTEHHFGHEGFELVPNPLMVGADIAARTSRIRIGQAANIVTFWNPMRLAEDIAMLDELSRGRVEVGVGRGLYGREAMNLNPLADPRDQEQNRELFEETIDILRKAWSGDFFSHNGQFHQYPAPGVSWDHPLSPASPEFVGDDGTISAMKVVPNTFQDPHPPLSQVIDSPRSIQSAARAGMNGMFWMPPVSELKGRFELYRDTLSEATGVEQDLGTGLSLVRDVYVADTMEQARADFEEALLTSYRWVCHWRGLGNLREVGEDIAGRELDYDFLAERNLLVGTPDYVAEKVHELQQELNLQDLLLWTTHPGMDHGKVMRSFELFTEKVMPQFAENPA
ncbi:MULTISPECIES: LLM class flavin-dependent oxidoreductase [Prauserella salsuginis group]|uniref:LLM class flavin-dependent oxidoreductase n=1 Tax=Prauserella salsuginis TaxID=387889 RepID=A0ABW6G7Z7_9PSEU|nr:MULTISPECIES: LLM class flavin-dependent oxidoreductase [Prauserella salsuginis group]MCR3721711.1 Flavin-dependent oxidoreductase, luciferase family (includes alkanesulfonate monooxygenase SsuD and methylene tetrahydromethanopterin reductase) [Prauserella flava]MCR3734403.1 Flavin-dependent oxidoreductase, luciferase family (includes alkanesulfonate monooxygenase SsuD and methylene tetrahydromethanopterin reductase) [Prauserella salsuginis]